MSTANITILQKRRLASGHRATLTRCMNCGQRKWHIGAAPGGCPCATERGGNR
jgi:hypothetical protein